MFRFHLVLCRSKSKVRQGSMYVQSPQTSKLVQASMLVNGGKADRGVPYHWYLVRPLPVCRSHVPAAAVPALKLSSHVRLQCELGRGSGSSEPPGSSSGLQRSGSRLRSKPRRLPSATATEKPLFCRRGVPARAVRKSGKEHLARFTTRDHSRTQANSRHA